MARWNLRNGEFIPTVGPPGPSGPPGLDGEPGLVWRGFWDSDIEYHAGDAVNFLGASWIATETSTGMRPDVWPGRWDYLSQRGEKGDPGDSHVPDPSSESDDYQLKVNNGDLTYAAPGIAVTGTTAAPITDVNAPRPDAVFVLWFAEVHPTNAANIDLIVRVDEAE